MLTFQEKVLQQLHELCYVESKISPLSEDFLSLERVA